MQKHDPNITSIHHVPFLALRSPHLTHKPDTTPHWPPTPSHTLRDTSKHSDHQASIFFLKHLVPRWAGPRAWLTQGASPVWPGVTPFSARCLRKKMKRWMIVEFRKQDRQRFHVRRDPPERERRTHSLSHITEPSTSVPESHMVCTNGRANATAASTHPCITEPHPPAAPSASSATAIRFVLKTKPHNPKLEQKRYPNILSIHPSLPSQAVLNDLDWRVRRGGSWKLI